MVDLGTPPPLVNIGSAPNVLDADTLRVGWNKANTWFSYLLLAFGENVPLLSFGEGAPTDGDGVDPNSGTGVDDGYYIDFDGLAVYGPRVNGQWGTGRSFQGPPGNATNGIPSAGAAGQALLKATSANFNVGWYNIIRSLGPALIVQQAAINKGQILTKGDADMLNALGWLYFAERSPLQNDVTGQPTDNNGSVLFNYNGFFAPKMLLVHDLFDILERDEESPEQYGDVLTRVDDGKYQFLPPASAVFRQFYGSEYDTLDATHWLLVPFDTFSDPTAPVEMVQGGVARFHVNANVQATLSLTVRIPETVTLSSAGHVEVILERYNDEDEDWVLVPNCNRFLPIDTTDAIQSIDFMWPIAVKDLDCYRVRARTDENATGKIQIVGPRTAIFFGS